MAARPNVSSSDAKAAALPAHEASKRLYERAQRIMPGGTARTSTYFKPHPLYVSHGKGARFWDVDGAEYLDFSGNFTSMIVGHANEAVCKAAVKAIARGTSFGFASAGEVELAELISERVASVDQVRFMCSGSEAVMMALRAARALTGRQSIAKCEGAFHGSSDFVEVALDSSPSNWGEPEHPVSKLSGVGIPQVVADSVIVIPFNDVERARPVLDAHKGDLAAILFDPMPNKVGLVPASDEFVAMLREFCTANGALLISDEVINLRAAKGGAQEYWNYQADLTVMGKIIGGGLPVGAVGGPKSFMRAFDPSTGKALVSQSGTFAGNPAAMAAGAATLRLLDAETLARLASLGDYARSALRDVIADVGAPAQVTGAHSLFRIHLHQRQISSYRDAYPHANERARATALQQSLLLNGVFVTDLLTGAISTPMTKDDVEQMAEAVRRCLPQVVELDA